MNSSSYRILVPTLLLSCLFISSCGPEKKPAASATPAAQAQAPTLQQQSTHPTPAPQKAAPVKTAATPTATETVDQLIARAEAEYARGQANYNAGHLEAAKDNFDTAFNILLRGPMGVQSDEKLQAEFDKIVEATHELELQALKAGDGFTEQSAEPAPIDEANNITFPVDPSIKAKAQAELANTRSDLPLMLTDPVASYINYFSTRGHGTIERALIRRGRYVDMISRIFREEGVPQDLIFLAQAESGFQPLALSRMGARGMWQFMPWDGTHAGLQRNWWVDERQDPEKATRAAARLLHDLYNQFGDWYLAMAAYNSGPGTVQRAVQRTGYADFWELYKRNVLPGETRNYVPIILAMTIMAKNPGQYGLDHLPYEPPLASETVRIHYPIDLRLVAECTDSSLAVLQELNPSLLRMTTPKDTDFELHVPKGTAEKFESAVAAIPEDMRVSWRFHRVQSGETLTEIARRYRTTASAISEANNLQNDELAKDMKLIIPVSPAKTVSTEQAPARAAASTGYSKTAVRYSVRKGDTVLSVADDLGVPAEKVRQWNHLKGNTLRSGRSLMIYKPPAATASAKHSASSASEDDDPPRSRTHTASKSSHSPRSHAKSARGAKGRKEVAEDEETSAKKFKETTASRKKDAAGSNKKEKAAASAHSGKKEKEDEAPAAKNGKGKVREAAKPAPSKSRKHRQQG